MSTVLIIDDDDAFLDTVRAYVRCRFPGITLRTCDDPVHCLASISTDLDLLFIDLEMPGLDGAKVLAYAASRGVDRKRIIILSGRDAEYLHRRFPPGSCLGVLNKFEARQQEALDMIFAALQQHGPTRSRDDGESGPAIASDPVGIPIDGTLDLHAFHPDEAGSVVRDYLAACRERGIVDVRIIHGKGIGTLRETVHALLSRMTEVESFRLAGEDAGGWGATIVRLKGR